MVFTGNGYLDGTEPTEAVSMMVNLSRVGAEVTFVSSTRFQSQTINHQDGKIAKSDIRNIAKESARITRGHVEAIIGINVDDFDALIIPGGYGVAKNASDYGKNHETMEVFPDYENKIREFIEHKKVIVTCCMSPILVARILGT
jgi:enhancing lycopene biosynthesis protein 2